MVLTRLSLTMTGSRRPGSCARTASNIPQLQNEMPAAPAPLRKFLRVFILVSSPENLFLQQPAPPPARQHDCSPSAPFDQAAFGYSEDAQTNRGRLAPPHLPACG